MLGRRPRANAGATAAEGGGPASAARAKEAAVELYLEQPGFVTFVARLALRLYGGLPGGMSLAQMVSSFCEQLGKRDGVVACASRFARRLAPPRLDAAAEPALPGESSAQRARPLTRELLACVAHSLAT